MLGGGNCNNMNKTGIILAPDFVSHFSFIYRQKLYSLELIKKITMLFLMKQFKNQIYFKFGIMHQVIL